MPSPVTAGVAHTHGHNDHVAGDGQFAARPKTTVVSRELTVVQEFFGFTEWPGQVVEFDLAGRLLEITGSPGHHRAAITVHDRWSGFLITGDTGAARPHLRLRLSGIPRQHGPDGAVRQQPRGHARDGLPYGDDQQPRPRLSARLSLAAGRAAAAEDSAAADCRP